MTRLISFILLMLIATGPVRSAIAGQTPSPSPAEPCANEATGDSSYRLRVGDVLDINFRFTPEFTASATIRPDGKIAMSSIGEVTAAGLTTGQFTCVIAAAYGAILREPIISVSVRDFAHPSFIVGGEVERPGKYELRSDTTITEAIAIAGGFKRSAKQSQVYLFRRAAGNSEMETRLVDVKAMLQKGQIAQDVRIESDDMVYVPQSGFSKIERFIPVPGAGFFIPVP